MLMFYVLMAFVKGGVKVKTSPQTAIKRTSHTIIGRVSVYITAY